MRNLILFILLSTTCFAVEKIPYETQAVMNFVKSYLPKDPIILECGGFDGTDTKLMAKTWPKSTIYTFEPHPLLFSKLLNTVQPYLNIYPFSLALADRDDVMTFYLSRFGDMHTGSSSLLPPKEHLNFDGSRFDEQINVIAMKLDSWANRAHVDHIDFMWLDMQGYELNMLQVSELAKKAKVIYIEVIFVEAYEGQYLYADVKKWMLENGFELVALDFDETIGLAGSRVIKPGNGIPYFGNAVFVKKKRK